MAGLRLFDHRAGVTLVTSPGNGDGWWAGAPSRATWRGVELLTYRLRAPRPRRGYEVRIARPEDNYGEQTGIARRDRDGRWRRVTTRGPVLPARYVAFDGDRFFWEHALPDGSHELRAAQPSVAVEIESTDGR